MPEYPELLTTEELAAALRVPVSWVYDKSRKNAIPVIRVGRYNRFRLGEVMDCLESHQKGDA